MPARLQLLERILFPSRSRSFVCSNCRYKLSLLTDHGRSRAQAHSKKYGWQIQLRAASTIPSVTAVNAKREIPTAFQELHASLKALEQHAGVYVDTSQLKLALRGIESEDALTRVAVLGLNGQAGARRLARVLLADPLVQEQPWEKQLLGSEERSDGKAILLRHGENLGIDERHPLVRTFSIPSSVLLTHNLEILVHTTTPTTESSKEDAAGLLVPQLEIANSANGRFSMVTYPVHKALVYQQGLNRLATFVAIEAHQDQRRRGEMLKGVIDWSWSTAQQQNEEIQPLTPINLALAEAGIEALRNSLNKSLEYERLWFDAGIPVLTAWLAEGTGGQPGPIKPTVMRLIETICENAGQGIQREAAAKLQQEEEAKVPVSTRNILSQRISIWAENGHTELRDHLNVAFDSKDWRKTKWWKLFWRVDEVGYIAMDILRRVWLVEAEKEIIWISGRIHQSALLGPPEMRLAPAIDRNDERPEADIRLLAPSAADLSPQPSNFNEPTSIRHPWPQDISRARSTLASLTVPPLQALSQGLMLQTVSTNVLASSLAALVYASISTTSPYESGAIAATGLVWSLRRLQKRWESTRREWEADIREEGRRVLRSVEGLARGAVEGYRPEVDKVSIEARAAAAEAVRNVRTALGALRS